MPNRREREPALASTNPVLVTRLGRAAKAPLLGLLAAYRYAVAPLLGVNGR
jgi:hypothetical protein